MKKSIIFMIVFLLVFEVGIFSISHYYTSKVNKLDVKNDGKMFALMVEQNKGAADYQELNDEEWPSKNYKINKDKSYCEDSDGNKIAKASGYDMIDVQEGKAIVKTAKTVYCYLYFDIKTDIDFTFYLGGESNPKYTNNKNIRLYINTNDSEADKYCINKTNNTNGCTWKNLSELSYTLDSTNGTQTYYVFMKSKDGTITEKYQSDEIILDDVSPNCYFDVNSSGVTFNFSDNLELDGGGTSGTEYKGALSATTFYGFVKDSAGNTCSVNKTISMGTSETLYMLYSNVYWTTSCQLVYAWPMYYVTEAECRNIRPGGYGPDGWFSGGVCCSDCTPFSMCSKDETTTSISCPYGTTQIWGTNYCA